MVTSSTLGVRRSQAQPKPLYHTLMLMAVGCLYILFVTIVQPFYSVNLWLSDQLFIAEPPSPNIVIIGIDDDTLATYGNWASWPRSLHAQAINNLSKARAKEIGFDVLFAENTPDDEILAAAMKSTGNVILPLVGTDIQPSTDHLITYSHIISPASILGQSAANIGHGNILTDPDGKVRRVPLVIKDSEGHEYPAFSMVVLQNLLSSQLPQEYIRQGGKLRALGRDIPLDTSYCFRINFAPEDTSRPYISYKDVISGAFNPQVVKDKIVLIGMVATGELDKWVVPSSSGKVPGVFIQATIADNILRQQYVVEAGALINLLILLLILSIIGLALPRLRLRWGGALSGVMFAGFLLASFFAFEKGYILNILYPLAMLPVIYVSSSIIQNAAMAIENNKLNLKVAEGYKSTIRALAEAIDAKDHYTRGHSQRVTELTLMAARELGMSSKEIEVLEYAGILHDIGKIGIPDDILTKPGSLTREEFERIRQHPGLGANIIKDVAFLEEARKLVLHHHEKYDGTGYPDGLKGDDIPPGARLLAVADAFDSMTSNRSYRGAMSTEAALKELEACCGKQFCPIAIEAFVTGLRKDLVPINDQSPPISLPPKSDDKSPI